MSSSLHRVLVVAATDRELAVSGGWRTLCCGVGPVEAAAATATVIAHDPPAAILLVGIAGTRRAGGLAPGTLVIGTEARYHDLVVPAVLAPVITVASPALVAAVAGAFPDAPCVPIGTSGRIGGTTDTNVEAMEGFAVLRAAERAGIPAVEVRAISNDIEEHDRGRWHFAAAFDAVTAATGRLAEAVSRCVS